MGGDAVGGQHLQGEGDGRGRADGDRTGGRGDQPGGSVPATAVKVAICDTAPSMALTPAVPAAMGVVCILRNCMPVTPEAVDQASGAVCA